VTPQLAALVEALDSTPPVPAPRWPERQPLPSPAPVPTLPPELLPSPLRLWLVEAAERMSVPLEFLAAPAVVALASVVGRLVTMRPEEGAPWLVVPNLWGAIVGGPATLKSACIGEATAPLRPLVDAEREKFEEARLAAEAQKIAIEAELARLKRTRDPDPLEIEALLRAKEAVTVRERRFLTSDSTVEKLTELLQASPRGLLVLRDELTGWLAAFDRPGREGERAFYLEAWNGDGAFTADRIGRGTTRVKALCLSVFGAIQPHRVAPLVHEAVHGGGADGLLARLHLLVWPDEIPPFKKPAGKANADARGRAFAVFHRLAHAGAGELGAVVPEEGLPWLGFAPAAQKVFDLWRAELEERLRGPEMQATPAFAAHLGKYRSLMPAMALLSHLAEVADGTARPGPVPESAARVAAAWAEYLELHAKKLYRAELQGDLSAAEALARRMTAGEVQDGTPVRELYRRQWSGLRTPEAVWDGLLALEKLGWCRVEDVPTGGRPLHLVRLHPELGGAP